MKMKFLSKIGAIANLITITSIFSDHEDEAFILIYKIFPKI